MKKVVLCATALMIGAIAFAQNTSDVNSVGDNNTVEVTQIGDLNDSDVDQLGDGNFAYIDQVAGNSNTAISEVDGDGNNVDIDQIGNSNYARLNATVAGGTYFSDDNTMNSYQFGDNNRLEVSIIGGDDNEVNADQIGNNNFHRFNSVRGNDNTIDLDVDGNGNRGHWSITVGWPPSANDNTLNIKQHGDINYATGAISGSGNTAMIVQDGDNNRIGTSWFTSDGIIMNGDNNTSNINQTHDWNVASTNQTNNGVGIGNQSQIDQMGNTNTATVVQTIP